MTKHTITRSHARPRFASPTRRQTRRPTRQPAAPSALSSCWLVLGWSPWWWIVPLGLYVGLITRLVVGWQAVKAGEVVLRRRRLMRPATRRRCGIGLGVLLPVVLAGVFYTAAQQWDLACVGLLVALWACEEQLIETILG